MYSGLTCSYVISLVLIRRTYMYTCTSGLICYTCVKYGVLNSVHANVHVALTYLITCAFKCYMYVYLHVHRHLHVLVHVQGSVYAVLKCFKNSSKLHSAIRFIHVHLTVCIYMHMYNCSCLQSAYCTSLC